MGKSVPMLVYGEKKKKAPEVDFLAIWQKFQLLLLF